MPRPQPLPPVPSRGEQLLDLLAKEAPMVLATATRAAALGAMVDWVMNGSINARVPKAATKRGARVEAWITRHRQALLDTVCDAADDELVIRLATLLLVLAPADLDRQWAVRLTERAASAAQTARRPVEEAVVCELGARWHIAAGNFDHADALHDRELHVLLGLRPRYGAKAIVALLWRRTRLAWVRGRWNDTLNHLSALTATLYERPDLFNQVLTQIARAEVLYAKGELFTASAELAAADRYAAEHPQLILERVDAQLTLGHALHAVDGPPTAQRQWVRTHTHVVAAITTSADTGLSLGIVSALEQRRRHLRELLDTPTGSQPRRVDDFTVLNPTIERIWPAATSINSRRVSS